MHVICVTETWFHAAISNSSFLTVVRTWCFRTDRSAALGGGDMCILTNNCPSKVSPISVPSKYSSLHAMRCRHAIACSSRLRLFVYRPSSSDSRCSEYASSL
jgi:hypothetical protein